MDYKELLVCISVITTELFFSSVAGTGKCSAQTTSHLSAPHESAVKGKYKSPLYKLWQYATKNKPSRYNDGVVYYNNKRNPYIQRLFTSYKCFLKRFLQLKNFIKQASSIEFQKPFLLKNSVFFRKSDNTGWRNVPCLIPHTDLVGCTLAYIRNPLRKKQANNHKEYFKLNNLVLQIYKIKRQRQKAPRRIGIRTNKILHNKVYC
ncbi:hypothetical protein [Bartonella sp. TT121SHDZB]|uniref:hypothetical protein n=1 Tax=Bartonella sp. TT121SHDZB TaxID=3243580 RepID=UPI0035D01591